MKIIPYRKLNELRPMGNMLSFFDDFFNRTFEEECGFYSFRSMALDIVDH